MITNSPGMQILSGRVGLNTMTPAGHYQQYTEAQIKSLFPEPPPPGIMPEWLWLEHRLDMLEELLERYREAGQEPKQVWRDELIRHREELEKCKHS